MDWLPRAAAEALLGTNDRTTGETRSLSENGNLSSIDPVEPDMGSDIQFSSGYRYTD